LIGRPAIFDSPVARAVSSHPTSIQFSATSIAATVAFAGTPSLTGNPSSPARQDSLRLYTCGARFYALNPATQIPRRTQGPARVVILSSSDKDARRTSATPSLKLFIRRKWKTTPAAANMPPHAGTTPPTQSAVKTQSVSAQKSLPPPACTAPPLPAASPPRKRSGSGS
jgi:hypothetical protein